MPKTTQSPCIILIIMAIVLLSAPVTPAWGDRALVIGIGAYSENPDIISPLRGPANDARAMQAFLQTQARYSPSDIKLLLDAEATRQGILAAIETWLLDGTRPGDRVLLFFAGHGAQVPSEQAPNEMDQVLLAVDARVDETGTLLNIIRDKELDRWLNRMSDRQITVIVDACHSGGITRQIGTRSPGLEGLVRTPLNLPAALKLPPVAVQRSIGERSPASLVPSSPNRTVWSAASSWQAAFEYIRKEPRMGFFTHYFIQGISENRADLDGDGLITHLELHRWLDRQSQEYCKWLGPQCSLGLTPTLEVDLVRQIVPVQVTLAGTPPPPPAPVTAVAAQALTTPAPQVAQEPETAPGTVRISILPAERLRKGQTVRFRVESDFDGYLLLLNIDPQDNLVPLFPNAISERQGKGNRIERHRPITIPDGTYGFRFDVDEPLGTGRLLALVTADPVDFSDLLSAGRNIVAVSACQKTDCFEAVPAGQKTDYLLHISARLRAPWLKDTQDRALRWAVGEADYITTP